MGLSAAVEEAEGAFQGAGAEAAGEPLELAAGGEARPGDALGPAVGAQSVDPSLTAVARIADAAELQARYGVVDQAVVDRDGARVQARRDPAGAARVGRPHRGVQPER